MPKKEEHKRSDSTKLEIEMTAKHTKQPTNQEDTLPPATQASLAQESEISNSRKRKKHHRRQEPLSLDASVLETINNEDITEPLTATRRVRRRSTPQSEGGFSEEMLSSIFKDTSLNERTAPFAAVVSNSSSSNSIIEPPNNDSQNWVQQVLKSDIAPLTTHLERQESREEDSKKNAGINPF